MEASPRIHAPDGGACILRRDRVLQRQDRASPHLVYVKVDDGEGDAGHDVEPAPAARAAIEPRLPRAVTWGLQDSQAFCRKKGARLQRRSPRQGSPARRRRRPPRAEAAAATDQKREGDET